MRLSYLDVDGDCIVVDSTDDLVDAIDQFADQRVLRLFVGDVTPSMRQVFLDSLSTPSESERKLHQKQMILPNGSEMELAIERQIEMVLEKRFRLLEQKRREIEEGVTPISIAGKESIPSSSLRPPSPYNRQPLPPHAQQQHLHQRRPSYGNNISQLRSQGQMSTEEEYLSHGNSGGDEQNLSTRLPWEATEDALRPPRAPHPSPQQKQQQQHHQQQQHKTRLGFRGDGGIRDEAEETDLYDLTVQSRNSRRSQSPSPIITKSNINSHGTEQGTLRAKSPMSPLMMDSRYMANSKPSMSHEYIGNDGNDNDYDNDDDLRENIIDLADNEDAFEDHLGSPLSHSPFHRSIEWENNTVDSDAELSLLLSDTDFREADTRDDLISPKQDGGSVASFERQGVAEPKNNNSNSNQGPSLPTLTSSQRTGPNSDTTPTTATNNHNHKPPVAPSSNTSSHLKSIPRPSPPMAKKNKLLGILYNSE